MATVQTHGLTQNPASDLYSVCPTVIVPFQNEMSPQDHSRLQKNHDPDQNGKYSVVYTLRKMHLQIHLFQINPQQLPDLRQDCPDTDSALDHFQFYLYLS